MGSLSLKTAKDYYFLGLWLADGYWWSSSIGLSSTNKVFIEGFRLFLKKICPTNPIKERTYYPGHGKKRRLVSKHIYVNSRSLTRDFMNLKHSKRFEIPLKFLPAYFAGRIDGDGHVDRKYRTGIRIAYSDKEDAVRDRNLLLKLNKKPVSLYHYTAANTWVLYFRKNFLIEIQPKIAKYCFKLKNL